MTESGRPDDERRDAARRAARLRWAGRAFISVGILTAAALFADLAALPAALAALPLHILALAFVLNLAGSIVAPALQTRIALGVTRIRLSVARLLAINLMVRFFILVLPRPAAVGIRWWAYREGADEGGGSEAAALMVYERVVQTVVITGALVLLLAVERARLPAAAGALWVAGLACFLLALAGLAAFSWPWLAALPRRVLALPRVPTGISRRVDRLLAAVEAYPGLSPGRKAAILGLSVVYFVLFVVSFQVLLLGVGVDMGFAAVAWVRAVVFIVTLVPVTVGGIGVREAGFVGLLRLYGVPETQALAAAVAALGVQLAIGALGGAIAFALQLRGRRAARELEATPAPPAPE